MGLINLLFSNPLAFFVVSAGLILAITIHEAAHAFTADKLGDPTPRAQGRTTLDPRAHLDPWGTLLIFLAGFGWGKPVQFDPYNLKDVKRDSALIALAGPASNLIMASLLALLIRNTFIPGMAQVFAILLELNVMLAIFNLLPVYPLDGSKLAIALLPDQASYEYEKFMRRYGFWVLIALIIPWGGISPITQLIWPIIDKVVNFLVYF